MQGYFVSKTPYLLTRFNKANANNLSSTSLRWRCLFLKRVCNGRKLL